MCLTIIDHQISSTHRSGESFSFLFFCISPFRSVHLFFCVVLPISSVLSQSTPITSFRTVDLVNIIHSILPIPSVLPQSTPVGSLRIADLTNIIDQVSPFIFCMRSCPSHLFYLSSCLNFLDQFYTNFVNETLQNWSQQLLSTIASHTFSSSHPWAPHCPYTS